MKQALKATGWGLVVLAVLTFSWAVFPNLSENTQWAIAILVLCGVFGDQLDKAEQRHNEFRFRVTDDLHQIKRRLGID